MKKIIIVFLLMLFSTSAMSCMICSKTKRTFKITVCLPNIPCKIYIGVKDNDWTVRNEICKVVIDEKINYFPMQYTMIEQE